MKWNITILSLVICLLLGCQQQSKRDINAQTKEVGIRPLIDSAAHLSWVDAVNKGSINSVKEHYLPNAIKVISSDSILNNSSQIAKHYTYNKEMIISAESIFEIESNKERTINYELIKLKTVDLEEYIQLSIWRFKNETKVREFEFSGMRNLELMRNEEALLSQKERISERRNLWIKLCNDNNSENLVNQLYSSNTLYFNHKPLVTGIQNLIEEYAYMNDENYLLNLLPIKLEIVNENLTFEIGQCKGSYNGKYLIVWQKEFDGDWKVFIDSNV